IQGVFNLRVDEPDLCPRYVARLTRNVSIGPSPWWLQAALNAAGVRSINNVADVTNFIMLAWRNPVHAFDHDAVGGRELLVRRAGEGEKLTTLDGVDRTLSRENLLIADRDGGVALAGVMGGSESEVKDSTTSILPEVANFNPVNVRRTAKA